MNGLNEIRQMNEAASQQGGTPKRRCSLRSHITEGGDVKSIILHSATHRDTKFIDLTDEFKREFFRRVCDYYDIRYPAVLYDWETLDPDQIDKVVESYWGLYEQPEQKGTPGYDEAEDED